MKKNAKDNKEDRADLYYNILKECVNDWSTTADISEKLGISESDSAFSELRDLNFIEINLTGGSRIKLLPQGFSTYLTISSQKQSSKQARKATYFAIVAIAISILSFITSIIFNIIS